MSNALGIKGIMGLGKETTYGSAVDVTDRLLMISEGINFDYSDALHDYLHGGAGIPGQERLFEPVSGSFDCYVPYTVKSGAAFVSADLAIALGMGNPDWISGQGSNEIKFLDDLNVFGTLAYPKWRTDHTWEIISAMVKSFSLTVSLDKPMVLSVEIAAQDMLIGATTVNQGSELIALPTTVPDLVQLRHFVFRIGDQAGAMAAGDTTGISSFTINVNNNLTDHEQTTTDNASSHTEPEHPIQAVRNGFREVTLEVTIPRYGNDTFFDHVANDDNLQAELYATQPTSSEEFDIMFPNLKIQDIAAPIGGAEALGQTITFKALKRNANSDIAFGDAGTDDGEMWIETDNDRTAAIF